MGEVVELAEEHSFAGLSDLALEESDCLSVTKFKEERFLHELDRLHREFFHARNKHQNEQVDEDVCVLADGHEGALSNLFKLKFLLLYALSFLLGTTAGHNFLDDKGLFLAICGLTGLHQSILFFSHFLLLLLIVRLFCLNFWFLCSFFWLDSDEVEMRQEVIQLVRENEGLSISFDAQLFLACVEEVAKVNMEKEASVLLEHEV